ncbi:MAG: VIT1/CCC1 transporter family protein [Ilumatobacteraceae bacterium]
MAKHDRRSEPHDGHRSVSGGLARATVFGINDGLVSNVSLILGFASAGVDAGYVRLAGIAGAVAGAISMAAGEWVSISSQNDLIRRELDLELAELRENTEHETEELAAMYESHGMGADSAATAAAEVMRTPEAALAVHAREELGVDPGSLPSATVAAVLSLIAFTVGALMPVVPWYLGSGTGAAVASLAIGILAAAVVGAVVGRYADRSVPWSAVRQALIVIVACAITWGIGRLVGVNLS